MAKKAGKPQNLISKDYLKENYKDGKWIKDSPDEGGYDSVSEYAKANPQYIFASTEKPTKKGLLRAWVGIHDPDFVRSLGGEAGVRSLGNGGAAVRYGYINPKTGEVVSVGEHKAA